MPKQEVGSPDRWRSCWGICKDRPTGVQMSWIISKGYGSAIGEPIVLPLCSVGRRSSRHRDCSDPYCRPMGRLGSGAGPSGHPARCSLLPSPCNHHRPHRARNSGPGAHDELDGHALPVRHRAREGALLSADGFGSRPLLPAAAVLSLGSRGAEGRMAPGPQCASRGTAWPGQAWGSRRRGSPKP